MYSIHLNNLLFYAHHGYHEEETITGANFQVSLTIQFEAPENILHLQETVNYVEVYKTILEIFKKPSKLLETIAQDICQQLHAADDRIRTININITKLNPPISNFIGTVGISLSKSY